MKLAFCLFKYFPFGGLQRDFLRLARLCQAQGHEVHVYTMQWEGQKEPGFHLHLIPVSAKQNHTRIKQFIAQCAQELSDGRYDVVIGFNKMPFLHLYYAADVCYQARVREKKSAYYRLLPRYRYYKSLEKAVFDHDKDTQILLLSSKEQPKYQHYYQTHTSRFKVLSPAIQRFSNENAAAHRKAIRQEYHIPESAFLAVMVGSGFKTKGVDRAIKALAALPVEKREQCYLFVIGRDNAKAFQQLAKKLQVAEQVKFLGPRSDVPRFLHAGDFLLQPSYHENTGTAILEAMVAGLPVLTLQTCGYGHYVESANAGIVLADPFSQAAFDRAFLAMLDKNKNAVYAKNALAYVDSAPIYDNGPEFLQAVTEVANTNKTNTVRTAFYLHPSIRQLLPSTQQSFHALLKWQGEAFRQQKNRLTQRIDLAGISYFIKQHYGVGWWEIFKNLCQGKLPVLSAKNEWLALNALAHLDIPAPIPFGYGIEGLNPAGKHSFILLEALTRKISLEELCLDWPRNPPSPAFKRALIAQVAELARKIHDNGINHRDFYLCHFLLDLDNKDTRQPKLYLLDLHRAQIRKNVPLRWRIKDLAGLFFSSLEIGLTQRDLYYFMKKYSQTSLRNTIINQGPFWKKVQSRGNKLYQKHQG